MLSIGTHSIALTTGLKGTIFSAAIPEWKLRLRFKGIHKIESSGSSS